jgi:hypothetical protein
MTTLHYTAEVKAGLFLALPAEDYDLAIIFADVFNGNTGL